MYRIRAPTVQLAEILFRTGLLSTKIRRLEKRLRKRSVRHTLDRQLLRTKTIRPTSWMEVGFPAKPTEGLADSALRIEVIDCAVARMERALRKGHEKLNA